MRFYSLLLALSVFFSLQLFAFCPCTKQKRCFDSPEPFQKIYICPSQVYYHCHGTYFLNEEGRWEKARAILKDCGGLYALRIETQCGYCGRSYLEKTSSGGYDCPLFGEDNFIPRRQDLGTPPFCSKIDEPLPTPQPDKTKI